MSLTRNFYFLCGFHDWPRLKHIKTKTKKKKGEKDSSKLENK